MIDSVVLRSYRVLDVVNGTCSEQLFDIWVHGDRIRRATPAPLHITMKLSRGSREIDCRGMVRARLPACISPGGG